jgi:hypothetical protein
MNSHIAIVFKSKKKYNEILEEYNKIDERFCFVLSRSNHYFWDYANNKNLSKEDRERYYKYVKNCENLLSIMNDKFQVMREALKEVSDIHDNAAENLRDKCVNIKLFREISSGGSTPKLYENDEERNKLFEKMLDDMEKEEEEEENTQTLFSDEYSQDVDAI